MDIYQGKDHYPYIFDHKPRFFLGWFLYRLFKKASINESMKDSLKKMHKEGSVVYAIKYRGQLDFLLYHYNFRIKRLPYPKIAFDLNISLLLPFTKWLKIVLNRISLVFKRGRFQGPYESGFYKKAVEEGIPSLIFLVDPKGFIRHFIHSEKKHIQYLIDIQHDMERPIYIIPQLILYKKTPEKEYTSLKDIFFGFKDKPGLLRKIALFFRYHRKAFIDFGEPVNLKDYLSSQPPSRSSEEIAKEISHKLIESIDSQKRVVIGPIMKSRQQVKEIVLMDHSITQKIDKMASGSKKQLTSLKKTAGEFFDEIAADYNIAYVQFFHSALSILWNKIFEGIDVDMESLSKVRKWARKGTLVYVPSHKSHIDYLILNDVLFNNHLHIPRTAAGKNLLFWPMGHIFRKSGAFFIRRSFRNNKLYFEVFNRYIKALLEEGHPIEFFIEGGRSRNGKLVPPKTGFLSILLQAFNEKYTDDLIFVPTSIVYDRIIEEKTYLKELGGNRKEGENFGQMIKARRFLKRKYGKIYLRFDNAFSLNDYLSQHEISETDAHRELAYHIIKSINAITPITPLSLVATAILTNHRRGFNFSELFDTIDTLLKFLTHIKAPLTSSFSNPSNALNESLSLLTSWKIVDLLEDTDGEEESFYYVDEDKKLELEYYKNSIIHFFILHSLIAVSLLSGTEDIKDLELIESDYSFLKELFNNEFVFDSNEDTKEKVFSILNYFENESFLSQTEISGQYRVTRKGRNYLPIWASLSKTFLESYWIAVKSVSYRANKENSTGRLLKRMNYLGRRFHKLGVIEHIGALSQLNFKNALNYINGNFIVFNDQTKEKSIQYEKLSKIKHRLYEMSHF